MSYMDDSLLDIPEELEMKMLDIDRRITIGDSVYFDCEVDYED